MSGKQGWEEKGLEGSQKKRKLEGREEEEVRITEGSRRAMMRR